MLGTIVWLAGAYGFYRCMMNQCRRAAREGFRGEKQRLRALREG